MSDNANIIIAPRLFSPDVFYNAVTPAGSTISHIVGPNPMDGTQVMVNDQVIPRGLWDKYQVKDHDLIVVSIFPAGGDGGKNVLRVVLMVVVAVFAAYMGAGVAGLYSDMAGAMVSGAITMAGGLAVNALIPPQSATLAQGQTAIEQPAQSFSITSGENAYRHYGAVQKLYGFVRYAPSFGANGYTEVIGDDQYVNLLFCLGYAPMNISDIQIGDVGIESYEGVSYEVGNIDEINIYKNGVVEAPQNIRLCSTEYYVGSVLQDANPAHEGISTELIRAVEDDVTDRTVSIDFEFPQGLRSLSAEGSSSYASVDIEILAKHEATSIEEEFHNLFEKTDEQAGYTLIVNPALYPTWVGRNFVFKNGVDILIYSGVSGWTEIPEDTELYNQMAAAYSAYESHSRTNDYFSFFMTSNNLEQLYDFTDGGETYLSIGEYNTRYSNPYFSWMGYLSSYFASFLTTVNDTYGGGRNVDGTPYTYLQLFAADADEIFKDGSIWYNTANQKLQYLDTSLSGFVPISSYVYRAASPDVFGTVVRKTFSDNIINPQRKNVSFELQTLTAGFEIKIVSRRTTTGYEKYVFADFYVTSIRSVKKEAPVFDTDHNFQFLAMKIKATNQLMGAVNNVTIMGKSCLPIYDGTDWIDPVLEDGVWTQETDNPAWIYTDILHGPQVTNKVPYSQINVEKIKEWADINTADSIAYNNVHDGGLTMLDYLQMVSTTGRGQWSVSDSFFSIILDTEQTVPHQLISPRNSWGFSASKTFIKAPHALKVKYINPDNWQQDIVVVYNDGYDITNTTEFEELVTVGVTSADQAYKDGRYFFAAAKLRPEIYSVSMDFENLVARRGDLVTLVHDVLLVGSGAGRIREITDLRTIVVDEDFLFEDGKTYAVRVRKDDNTQIVIPIDMTAGTYNEIILSADATGAKVGDLVTYGETGKESIDVKIKEIEYNPDLSATLTLIDAAPDIHLADQGEIPAYEPNVTTPIDGTTLLPAPPEFREIEGGSFFDDGSIKKQLYINYLLPYDNKVSIKEVILFYRIHLGGEYAPTAWRSDRKPLQDGGFVIEVTDICPNDQNWALEFTMASISAWGRVGYQSISKYVSQDDVEFVDIFSEVYVSNFVISQTADGFGFTWDSVADVGAVGYLLKDVTDPLNEITISVSADTNTEYMVWYTPGSYDFEVTPYNKNGVYGTPTITTAIIPTSSMAIENVTVAWGELGRTINWDITGIWKDLVVSSDLVVTSLGTFHSASKNRVSVLGYIVPGTIAYEIRLYSKYDGQLLLSYESSFVEPSDSVVLSDLDPAAGEKLDGVTDGADVTDYTKTALTLLMGTANTSIVGNVIMKTGGASWGESVWGTKGITGACRLEFRREAICTTMVGFSLFDPSSDHDWDTIGFCMYLSSSILSDCWAVGQSAVNTTSVTVTLDDTFEIIYDGISTVRYYINGVEQPEHHTTTAGQTFYIDSSFVTNNAGIRILSWAPFATNNSAWEYPEDSTTIDGGKIHAGSELQIGNIDGVSDYCLLTAGDIDFYRYINATHRHAKSLKRIEGGEVPSGNSVPIPGYFSSEPQVIVSPFDLQVYNKDHSTSNQRIVCAAENLTGTADGVYSFDAIANLLLSDTPGSVTYNDQVWFSNEYSTKSTPTRTSIADVDSITVFGDYFISVRKEDYNSEKSFCGSLSGAPGYVTIYINIDGVDYTVVDKATNGTISGSYSKTLNFGVGAIRTCFVKATIKCTVTSDSGCAIVGYAHADLNYVTTNSSSTQVAEGSLSWIAIGE